MTSAAADTVLLVGPLPPPLNGMTVMTAHALEGLRGEGVQLVHVDTSDHRKVGNVGRLDLRNIWLAFSHAFRMFRAVRRTRPRLVYLPIAQGTLGILRDSFLFAVARLYRTPVVVHLHGAAFGAFYRASNRVMKGLIRACFSTTQSALVLTPSLRSAFGGVVPEERIVVVSNGIPEPPVFVAASPRKPALRVLFLSNLSRAKGIADFIAAAARVLATNSGVEFHVAGDWPSADDRVSTDRQVNDLSLRGKVLFHTPVIGLRKAELFHSADLFVFPPRQLEGQPVVILEAMSHGLPVVSTTQGGIVDTVDDGQTGILVPPGDSESLASAILTLVEDRELRLRYGRNGLVRYQQMFGPVRFGQTMASILRQSAGHGSAGGSQGLTGTD